MDNLWFFENDTRSSKERMSDNPNAPKWTPLMGRTYDQILSVAQKMEEQIEKENDQFFNARPFLTDDFTKEMRIKSGADMSIRQMTTDAKLRVLISELNRLWDEFSLLETKEAFK